MSKIKNTGLDQCGA